MSSLFPVIRPGNLRGVGSVFEDVDRVMNTFFGPTHRYDNPTDSMRSVYTTPRANVLKTPAGYSIELAAPGFSRDEFELLVEDNTLTVSISSEDTEDYKLALTSREFSYISFTRSWKLPTATMTKGIEARYEAGILVISVPVEGDGVRSQKIEVQ